MVALGPYLRQGTLNQSVQPTLAGDGLVLRPWREEDAAVVVAAYSQPDIGLFNRRTMDSEAEALEWIRAWALRWQGNRSELGGVPQRAGRGGGPRSAQPD